MPTVTDSPVTVGAGIVLLLPVTVGIVLLYKFNYNQSRDKNPNIPGFVSLSVKLYGATKIRIFSVHFGVLEIDGWGIKFYGSVKILLTLFVLSRSYSREGRGLSFLSKKA